MSFMSHSSPSIRYGSRQRSFQSSTRPSVSLKEGELRKQPTILGEKTIEQRILVPKKVTREETYEKHIVVPERKIVEDIVEDTVRIREKIVEVGKPVIQETIVEVPEIEYYETNVEFPSTIHQERLKHVERVEVVQEVVKVPKVIMVEKIVEVPEIEYREIPIEKIVEVPEYQDEVVIKEIPIDEYVEVPVQQDKLVDVLRDVHRKIPVSVEMVSEWKFVMPILKPKQRIQKLPIYVPRFIEVPIPSSYLSDVEFLEAKEIHAMMKRIAANPAPSLSEIEKLAELVKERQSLIRHSESKSTTSEIESKLQRHLDNVDTNFRPVV